MYVVHPKISYSFSGGMVGSRDHCSGRELQKSTCRLVWGDDVGGALLDEILNLELDPELLSSSSWTTEVGSPRIAPYDCLGTYVMSA